jgi:pimeloyl-ACP methyl ester carboxylesterase
MFGISAMARYARSVLSLLLAAGVFVALVPVDGSAAATRGATAFASRAGTRIAWNHCGRRLQCARVRVPLDWSRPGGRQISLRVARYIAGRPGGRIGTLFASPGGPGESGFDLITGSGAELDAIGRGRFNVVGWDPRGTNASARIRCFRSRKGLDRFWGGASIPETTAQSRRFRRKTAALAHRCGQVSGALLRHVSTADSARDLDYLRRLLGERRATFLGLSYGTFLDQTYANMFPRRVRAMVLDGVVDQLTYAKAEARLAAAVASSDEVFERFESLCESSGPTRCALAGRGPVKAGIDRLLAHLRQGPIPAPSAKPPGVLTYTDLLLALFEPLRSPGAWPHLAEELAAAEAGDGSALETQGRLMRSPEAWSGITTSAAIQCADGPARQGSRAWPKVIGRLEAVSYLQGLIQGWWEWAPCASWPVRDPGRYVGPWNAKTRNPILLIGTRHDPNTGYANARRAARRLGNAVLLTHDGYGHLSFKDPSACVERAETEYLVHLVVPRRGTVCASNRQPFDPEFGQPPP